MTSQAQLAEKENANNGRFNKAKEKISKDITDYCRRPDRYKRDKGRF